MKTYDPWQITPVQLAEVIHEADFHIYGAETRTCFGTQTATVLFYFIAEIEILDGPRYYVDHYVDEMDSEIRLCVKHKDGRVNTLRKWETWTRFRFEFEKVANSVLFGKLTLPGLHAQEES